MRKILNEWKRFLKESTIDDKEVAGSILAVIDPESISTPQPTEFLRINKQRAIRVIRDFLDNQSSSIFSVSPNRDVVRVGKAQHYFPERDFLDRLGGALSILEDPNSQFNFSQFNRKTKLSDREHQGKFGRKDHSGGAGDAGFVVPKGVSYDEIQTFVGHINDYKSSYLYKGEDYSMTTMEYKKSLESLISAYDVLIDIWDRYSPGSPETEKVNAAKLSAEYSYDQEMDLTPIELANAHMENGNKMLDARIKEAYVEFAAARRIFKKLKMADKVSDASAMFRKARDLR